MENNSSKTDEELKLSKEVEFNSLQLDLMLKALEMSSYSKNAEAGEKLFNRLHKIMRELQLKTVEVNKPLNDQYKRYER